MSKEKPPRTMINKNVSVTQQLSFRSWNHEISQAFFFSFFFFFFFKFFFIGIYFGTKGFQ